MIKFKFDKAVDGRRSGATQEINEVELDIEIEKGLHPQSRKPKSAILNHGVMTSADDACEAKYNEFMKGAKR